MSTGLMMDNNNQLHGVSKQNFSEQPLLLKILAKFVSYLFHPVFVPVYIVVFMVYVHPYLLWGLITYKNENSNDGGSIFYFFPLDYCNIIKGIKIYRQYLFKYSKERIIPIIACMTWYFWVWYVWNNFGKTNDAVDMPKPVIQFAFATFVSTVITLMVNIKMKVSLHAISMGIMTTFFLARIYTGVEFWHLAFYYIIYCRIGLYGTVYYIRSYTTGNIRRIISRFCINGYSLFLF